jgi:type IV secretory pathway VirB4 component
MPLQFNPFYANNLDEVTEEKIEFLSTLIQLIWKGDGAAIKTLEKQAIKEYVVRFYDDVFFNENVTLNIASFYEFVNRNKNKKSDDHYFNKESLLASLENFIGGKYKEVFNSSESINLIKKPLVVFNLGSIKDDAVLFPIVTMLCIDAFMDKIKEMPKVKKTIFINECWESISNKNLPDGIETLYIAVNKLNIELIIMTKDLQHVLDNSMGKTIIDNTDTLIMLNPKKSRDIKSKLATHLSLTESDLEKLYSINEREVFIKVGNLSNIYVIEEILCRLPRFRTPINLANNYY